MPGLDQSDDLAISRIKGVAEDKIDVKRQLYIEKAEQKIRDMEAIVEGVPVEQRESARLSYSRSIEREEALLVRLKSSDPWTYWPFIPDQRLHGAAAWAGTGYWQGFFEDVDSRYPLVKRQWDGAGIAASVGEFGFSVLRERLAIWAIAKWWAQVAGTFRDSTPRQAQEINGILTEDWWNNNLAGIVCGDGVGKKQTEQERRIYALRAEGHSWDRACRSVYPDQATAALIALHLAGWEAHRAPMAYGYDKRTWPPVRQSQAGSNNEQG